jgi:hypothetical protein
MTKRGDFNADDWSVVVEAPALAAAEVITAERGGTIREATSLARAYADARERHGSELVDALVAQPPQVNPSEVGSPDQLVEQAERKLGEAIAIVERQADAEETEDYKQFILTVARTVAAAHKEGGFLGIGGKEISDKEQAALDRIASTVGAEPPG